MSNWRDKKVLVTGAGGFIGSHLVEGLYRKGADVTAFVRYNSRSDWGMIHDIDPIIKENISIISGDITDSKTMKASFEGIDLVYHLAALNGIPYSYEAPGSYIHTNIIGTHQVLESCMHTGVERLVITSTSEVYGTAQYVPIDEKHPLCGQSPYSASKIAADKIAESYYHAFHFPVAIIRPFNTYGPRQSARAIIPTVISQALAGNMIKIGSRDPVRDLTYIDDTVRGFIQVGETDEALGKTINIGSGKGITIGDLTQKIVDLVNPDATIVSEECRVRPESSEVMALICDNRMAGDVLNWHPEVDLTSGLQRTITWIRDNLDRFKTEKYAI